MNARIRSAASHVILIGLCIVSLYPIWFLLQSGLKSDAQYAVNPLGAPLHPSLSTLVSVFQQLQFGRWLANSIIVTIVAVSASTVIAFFAAYGITFSRVPGRTALLNTNIALMSLPPVALIVPLFLVAVRTNLLNSLASVIIVYAGFVMPFAVFFLSNFLSEVPRELIEAARIDGASEVKIAYRVVGPLVGPGIATLAIVNSIWVWNELLYALVFLQTNGSRTLMAGLAVNQGRFASNQPAILMGSFLALLPLAVMYFVGQRFFVRGLTAGVGR